MQSNNGICYNRIYLSTSQKGDIMITYARLWETMKKKGITKYALIHTYGVSSGQIQRIRENKYVSTHTIERFCEILNCQVQDIMEYIEPEILD